MGGFHRQGRCEGGLEELRIHAYRAVLEVVLRELDPTLVRPGLGSLKGGWAMPFGEYARTALARLEIASERVAQVEWAKYEALVATAWEDVAKFFCVRVVLAPVLETVLLYDRTAWLRERGFRAGLHALFDPALSPRNLALCAVRELS